MQRMMDEEVQATVAFAATQRELQRMADEETHAAVRVGHLQHETVRKAGLLGEQAREVYQLYQQACAAFVHLQEPATTQNQQYPAGVQRVRGEFVEAEQVFRDMHSRDLEHQQQLQGFRALASQQSITA